MAAFCFNSSIRLHCASTTRSDDCFHSHQCPSLSAHLKPSSKESILNQVAVGPPVQMTNIQCRMNCFVSVSASRMSDCCRIPEFASHLKQNPRESRSSAHPLSEDVGVSLLREFLHGLCQRGTCQVCLLPHLEPLSDVLVLSHLQLRSCLFCEEHRRVHLFLQARKE
jgi:hypothetical protein